MLLFSFQDRVYFGLIAGQNTGPPADNGDGILHTPVFPRLLPLLLPVPLIGARTRFIPSRLPALMMAFFPRLTSPPSFHFFPQALGLFSHALGSASTGFFYAHCSCVTLDPWGASPFLFFPALSSVFSIFSSSIFCPRISSYSSPPLSHPCLRFLRHFTLFFFTFVKSHSATLAMCVCVCVCVCE